MAEDKPFIADNQIFTTAHESIILTKETVVFDEYLRVEDVRVVRDRAAYDAHVEVRAESIVHTKDHLWRSLRWHDHPDNAPRARDVVRVTVTRVQQAHPPQDPMCAPNE